MLLALALASSLWASAQEAGARADSGQAVQPAVVTVALANEFGEDLYWLIGSNAADLYSTAWALHRCRNCGESNFLGPTAEARVALKIAGVASTGMTLWKLRRDGHNGWARLIRWTSVAVNGAFVANNIRHAIRRE